MNRMNVGGLLPFLGLGLVAWWILKAAVFKPKDKKPLDTMPQAKRDPKSVKTIDL